ncbi:cell division protein ZipA-like isoform X2 [Plodia interpunctella]|uniref:cell division protein ZipA-like isoform X2 n=1 Tax=Plodia interpunctella TaxID=58824 RepID=UPI0023685664|nr:cell division protein ZipA-like isoform X2 [Plodia interpunctella]
MSGYPPHGPYYPPPGHYPPPHPHLPPGSFTYLPPAYSYQPPPPQWAQQSYYQPPQTPTQPYFQPPAQPHLQPPLSAQPHSQPPPTLPYYPAQPQIEPPTPTTTEPPNFTVNVVEQSETADPEPEAASTPVQEAISWVPATPTTAQNLDYKAVVGGKEGYDGSPLWIIRAHHKGEMIPGKLNIKHRYAYIPSLGKEIPVHNFDVLCSKPGGVQWLSAKNGQVPKKAVEAGYAINAEPLYIGRVSHKSSLTPGKVQPGHGCCYISFHGVEVSFRKYEVLCEII